ncbi:MAG: hypothetical protein EXS59_02880 [Candidatus Taylorbacteria bacterium]|nr:hypothetical protein [Candidatus Taylorbacteria bacterium]
MKNNNNSVRFGFVLSYDECHDLGWMRVGGEFQDVRFSLGSQRVVVEGVRFPCFGKESPKQSLMPKRGAQVAVALTQRYKLSTPEGHRILSRVVEATGWNYTFAWKDVEKQIADRPLYEVVKFSFYKGNPTDVNQRQVLNFGTAVVMQAMYPRGVENDPLAPETRILDLSYRRVWYLRTQQGTVQCSDPRPLPKGQVVVKKNPQPVNSQGVALENLGELLKLAESVNGRRRGTVSRKPGRELVSA